MYDYTYPKPITLDSKLPLDVQLTKNLQDTPIPPIKSIPIPIPNRQADPLDKFIDNTSCVIKLPTREEREESEDQLACHADNILRMAVDSTMLGSTFSFTIAEDCLLKNKAVSINADDITKAMEF